jgi:RIO-like serine/threonine protein kinase
MRDVAKRIDDGKLGEEIGRGVNGKVYAAKVGGIPLVIKASKVSSYQMRFVDKQYSQRALGQDTFIEQAAGKLINELVLQKICPHYPLQYASVINNECKPYFKSQKRCLLQYHEYIKGVSLENWAKRHSPSVKKWYNAFFQIMAALYALQTHFNMLHTDLHANNIMIKPIQPGGYWIYKIDGQRYYVPNLGLKCTS